MSTIVNLIGGSGIGKSTSASYLFYLFKSKSMNAELVGEFAKDLAWQSSVITKYDQIYITAQQIRKESILYNKAEYIITDAPVLLGLHYARSFNNMVMSKSVEDVIMSFYDQAKVDGHKHINVLLNRSKKYLHAGRYQTEEQAIEIDKSLKTILSSMNLEHTECGTDEHSLNELFKLILRT